MLNPDFRWLDPEADSIDRLRQLCGTEPADLAPGAPVRFVPPERSAELLSCWTSRLAKPGSRSWAEIRQARIEAIKDMGLDIPPDSGILGWREAELAPWFNAFHSPCVCLLGILDGDGIWCGGLAGISNGGLDFLGTFNYLWAGQPELAAKQSLFDLPELCRAASQRFRRPAAGLFIYRDEFVSWRNAQWSRNLLEHFLRHQTAAEHRP